ncbi:MAG TPA: hypothetical protein ENI97_12505 [Gammaproteobacteria bacterium]|nr:hypothetical protein [Gammaproteobacteria bacterium]
MSIATAPLLLCIVVCKRAEAVFDRRPEAVLNLKKSIDVDVAHGAGLSRFLVVAICGTLTLPACAERRYR